MVLDEEYPPDVRVEKEIKALHAAGHNVHLLCYTRSGQPLNEEMNGVAVSRVTISPLRYKMKALALLLPFYFNFWEKHISRQLQNEHYDALHFHDLTLAKVCLRAGQKVKVPVIGDYHENRPEIMKYYHHVRSFPGNVLISVRGWQKYQMVHTPHLDHLILVTPEAKDYYSRHYGVPAEKITVVENFPDLKELMQFDADDALIKKYSSRKMLLYFGDTGLRRGTATILEAAERMKNDPEYCFVIVGDSREQQKLLEMKQTKKLDNVELTGYLPLEKALSYFRAAHAGLSPLLGNIHHDTTYANKIFQYMAFGLPVVVSNCMAQASVVRESACGFVHQAGNAADLVQKIKLLDNPSEYRVMRKNAKEAVENKYNFTRSAKQLLSVYRQIKHEN
jgi:glycosyltransferase involved in cell wall biosynthesis